MKKNGQKYPKNKNRTSNAGQHWDFYNNSIPMSINEDSVLFADDASHYLNNINDITYKLPAYNAAACEIELGINWHKAKILTRDVRIAQTIINSSPEHYRKIQTDDNIKAIGNMMTANNISNKIANSRLNKAQTAWGSIKSNVLGEDFANKNSK